MKGLLFTWAGVGLLWFQVFEGAYRGSVKPSPVEYMAFAFLVVFGWPYPLYLIFKDKNGVRK